MRWRFWGGAALLFSSVFGLWWKVGVPRAEARLHVRLESVLSRTFHRPVRVERVRLSPFLLSLDIDGLRVGDPAAPLFACRRWTLRIALAEDTPYRWFFLTVGQSELDRPALRWSPGGGAVAIPWGGLPRHRLKWRDGFLETTVPGRGPLRLTEAEGLLDLRPGGAVASAQGRGDAGPWKARLDATAPDGRAARYRVEARLDSFPLHRLNEEPAVASRVALEGVVRVDAEAGGVWPAPAGAGPSWKVRLRAENAAFRARRRDGARSNPVPVDADVVWAPERLTIASFALWRAVVLRGEVERPESSDRTGRLVVEGDGLPLADLRDVLGGFWRRFPLSGRLRVSGRVDGALSNPEVEGRLDLSDGNLAGLRLPPMAVAGRRSPTVFAADVDLFGGRVRLEHAAASTETVRPWTAVARRVDLGEWAQVNGWPEVGGLFEGGWELRPASGPAGAPFTAEGAWSVDGFRWGAHHRAETVSGRLAWDARGFHAAGDGGRFDLSIGVSSGGWRVDRLAYGSPDGLRLEGEGALEGDPAVWNMRARLSGFPLRDLPPLVKRFPAVEGVLSADGALSGPLAAPVFSGGVRLEGVRWRPGGVVHRGDLEFHGSRRHVRVPRFSWDDVLLADGAWMPDRGWQWSATFAKAPAAEVLDFWPGASDLRGSLEGQVSLSGAGSRWPDARGWANLRWREAGWRDLAAERATLVFFLEKDRFLLDGLDVRQSSGRFHADGEWIRRADDRWTWRVRADATDFRARGRWSGAADGAGTSAVRRGEGAVELRGLARNGVAWGDGRARGRWSESEIALEELVAASGWRAAARWDWSTDGLSGDVFLDSRRWAEGWAGGIFRSTELAPGRCVARAALSGTGRAPELSLEADWSEAAWRGRGLAASLRARYRESRWSVSTATVRAAEGGEVRWAGELFRSTEGATARWSADVVGWEWGPWVRVFRPGAPGDGRLDGRWTGDGPLSRPRIETSLRADLRGAPGTGAVLAGRYAEGRFVARVLDVYAPEGRVSFRPGAEVAGDGPGVYLVRGTADARNARWGPLTFFGALAVDARVRPAEPVATARLTGQSLWVNQQLFDRDLAVVRWSPGELRFEPLPGGLPSVTGRVLTRGWPQVALENLEVRNGAERLLALSGEVGPARWDFTLQAWGAEAETLIALADFDWPLSGRWNARVRGRGTPADPGVEAEIRGRDGRWGPVPYDRLEAELSIAGSTVTVRKARAQRANGYVLSGEGYWPLRPSTAPALGLRVRLEDGDLRLLPEIWPVCRSARGAFSGELNLSPGEDGWRAAGYLRLRDGQLNNRTYARRVKNARLSLIWVDDRLTVQEGSAQVGDGRVVLRGGLRWPRGGAPEYDLELETLGERGVEIDVPQLSVPPGPVFSRLPLFQESLKGVSRGEPTFRLRATGPQGQHWITGVVRLDRTQFTYPPAKGALRGARGPRWWRDFWREARWDVRLDAGRDAWYRNEYVNVEIDGGLTLRGHPGAWYVDGKIAARQGVINYLGQNFLVTRGAFEVETDTRPGLSGGVYPYIAGEAEKTVAALDARGFANDDVVTMVVDRARLGEIQPRFLSRNSPGLSSDRVALRALGLAGGDEEISQIDRDQLLRAGLVQLVGASAAPLATRLARNFGIYMINTIYEPPDTVDTEPPSETTPPAPSPAAKGDLSSYLRGAGASARIRLSDRLFGVYKVKLDEAQNQTYFRDEIELVYRVARSLHLRASSELDSEKFLGQPPNRRVLLENQWRFGLPRRPAAPREDRP